MISDSDEGAVRLRLAWVNALEDESQVLPSYPLETQPCSGFGLLD